MSKSKSLAAIILFASISSQGAVPGQSKWALNLASDKGAVEFDAVGRPSAIKIHGKGSAPRGSLTLESLVVSGNITFDLESLDTGITMRNEHMKKKYLETEKYKEATLTLAKLTLPESLLKGDGSVENVPFTGSLLLHGIQKPVSGVAKIGRKNQLMLVDAQFSVKTNDYGITTPSFAGITLGEDVNVLVQFTAPMTSVK